MLIDHENVQPNSLSGLDAKSSRVLVFVGASQNKLSFDLAEAMQKLGSRGEYIRTTGNGSNALDFHIAFHMGRIAAEDQTACFPIISKDTWFGPLIRHMKERKVQASRWKDVREIPSLKAAGGKSEPDKVTAVIENLMKQRGASRPRALKTLKSAINSLFQKQLGEEELGAMLKELEERG